MWKWIPAWDKRRNLWTMIIPILKDDKRNVACLVQRPNNKRNAIIHRTQLTMLTWNWKVQKPNDEQYRRQ